MCGGLSIVLLEAALPVGRFTSSSRAGRLWAGDSMGNKVFQVCEHARMAGMAGRLWATGSMGNKVMQVGEHARMAGRAGR